MSSPGRPGCSWDSAPLSAAAAVLYGSGSGWPGRSGSGVISSTIYRRPPMARSSTSPLSRPRAYNARIAAVSRCFPDLLRPEESRPPGPPLSS
ncbi:hypothetical protein [Paenibacillus sp. PK3_47]|uniref:hypothetical protein n=1 Tax=Paenibacillus sp. PK3_47 TaxID=2072642 RepID=UPI00201D9047|nr:hypothetical protein [Paenibacillus sp. PK3_47]